MANRSQSRANPKDQTTNPTPNSTQPNLPNSTQPTVLVIFSSSPLLQTVRHPAGRPSSAVSDQSLLPGLLEGLLKKRATWSLYRYLKCSLPPPKIKALARRFWRLPMGGLGYFEVALFLLRCSSQEGLRLVRLTS